MPRNNGATDGATGVATSTRGLKHFNAATFGLYAFLIIMLVLTLAPFYMLINVSLMDIDHFQVNPMGLATPLHPENFRQAWDTLNPYLLNSTIITGVVCFVGLMLGSITAFVLARFKFPGKEAIFGLFLALLMVPGVLTLIPIFSFVIQLNLMNNKLALILPYLVGGVVFNTFMMRSFIASLPEEMFEAARLDGAGYLSQYWSLTLPLSGPIMSVLAIWSILGTWNDYLYPSLVLQDDGAKTIAVKLVSLAQSPPTISSGLAQMSVPNYPLEFAGYSIAMIPMFVLFLIFMRSFVAGIGSGAIKA